ncbi:hypothetical protein [Acinetobacter modestus]|uniref:hypothetical protein n=1 Tax=Acinetobacter modestus TaxID=1776740 RepID=UPI00301597BF
MQHFYVGKLVQSKKQKTGIMTVEAINDDGTIYCKSINKESGVEEVKRYLLSELTWVMNINPNDLLKIQNETTNYRKSLYSWGG